MGAGEALNQNYGGGVQQQIIFLQFDQTVICAWKGTQIEQEIGKNMPKKEHQSLPRTHQAGMWWKATPLSRFGMFKTQGQYRRTP